MIETINNVTSEVASGYLESGAIGLVAVTFLALFLVSQYRDYKKDETQDKMTKSLGEMAENQTQLTTMYKNSIERHEQVVELLTSVLEKERSSTKECYDRMLSNQNDMDKKMDKVIGLVSKNA